MFFFKSRRSRIIKYKNLQECVCTYVHVVVEVQYILFFKICFIFHSIINECFIIYYYYFNKQRCVSREKMEKMEKNVCIFSRQKK